MNKPTQEDIAALELCLEQLVGPGKTATKAVAKAVASSIGIRPTNPKQAELIRKVDPEVASLLAGALYKRDDKYGDPNLKVEARLTRHDIMYYLIHGTLEPNSRAAMIPKGVS